MSDNLPVSPGTGATIAADDVGGVLHQRVKVVIGADGVSDGDISAANPMPVTGTVAISNSSVEISNDVGNPIPVSGTVAISNSSIEIANDVGNPVPVNGTVTANAGTNLNTSALNLETTQAAMSAKLPATLGAKTTANSLAVNIASDQTVPVSGTVTANLGTIAGASTSALQTTGNSSLSSIDTKTPALGQALAAASTPVVLTAAQIATLTPLSSVSVSNFPATQPVSIAASVAVTGPLTDTQLRATAVPVSGTVAVSTLPAIPAGTNVIGHVIVDSAPTTTVTGTVTSNIGTGNLTGITNTVVVKADTLVNQTNAFKVDGSAVTQPVSGTVAISGTPNVAVTSLPALPTGANTIGAISNTAFTANAGTNLNTSALNLETTQAAMSAKLPASLGAKTTANSLAVNIASDQTVPVSSTTLATSALQTSGNALLTTIAANTGAQSVDTLQTGTITALNGNVAINAQGAYTVLAQLTGTWVGTVIFEGLLPDATTWQQLPASIVTASLPYASTFSTTANGVFLITGGGYTQIRTRASLFTSGTISVALNASLAQQTILSSQLGQWNVNPAVPTFQNTTAALGSGATFTSQTFDTIDGRAYVSYSAFSVTTLTIYFDASADGTNWYTADTYQVAAGSSNYSCHKTSGRYSRVRVVNGSVANAGGIANLSVSFAQSSVGSETDIMVVDAFGNPINSVLSAGLYNLAVAQGATNYVASSVNSSVAQLAASATFTGTPESTFNQQSYSILVTSDQNMTLTVLQYIDAAGTKVISSIPYSIIAGAPFARSGVLNGNYCKVTVQNNGASATTTFQIDTAYGTIPSATQLNNAPCAINEINGVAFSTTTKNAQATNVLPTQDLHNSGRNTTNYFMAAQVISSSTDTLVSLTGYKSGAAVTATTTPAVVTAGKTFRVTSITLTYIGIATAGSIRFTLRANTGGVVAIGSPVVDNWIIGTSSATAGVSSTISIPIPEGIEFAAGTGIGLSILGLGATGTAAAVGYGVAVIKGYEY
jgi:hypothetical protein